MDEPRLAAPVGKPRPKGLRRLSIKHLLVGFFGGLALVIWLSIYLYINQVYASRLAQDRGDAINDLAIAAASVVAANLKERQREITLLAQTPAFQQEALDSPALKSMVQRVQQSYPRYVWIGVADLDGTVRAATGDLLKGQSVRERPWFKAGLSRPFSGDLHEAAMLRPLLPTSANGDAPHLIDFAAPLRDARGELRGVLGAHTDWAWAADVVQGLKPANAAQSKLEILIVNRKRQVIHPQRYNGLLALPAAVNPDRAYGIDSWQDGGDHVSSMVSVREGGVGPTLGWSVVVRQPLGQWLGDVEALQQVMLLLILLSAMVFIALVWWGATLITRPLKQLGEQARRIAEGEEHTPLTVQGSTAEVHELADALRGMAATLVQRSQALARNYLVLEQTVTERTADLARANRELRQIARMDALTRLPNRLSGNERLRTEFVRMQRSKVAYVVMMIDIDHFKQINDNHGHAAGDEVLQRVAQALKAGLRESDFIARVGGEEFQVLLPATGMDAARQVAEKLRLHVESLNDPVAGKVTVSIGLGLARPRHLKEDDAVREADHWLYEAKRSGRNQVAADSLA